MKPYDTVLFDLDGTLLNTLLGLTSALTHVFLAHHFPAPTPETVRYGLGYGYIGLMERTLPEESPALHAQLAQEFNEWYSSHCLVATHPYDGIIDVLTHIKDNAIKTAIVSNKGAVAAKALYEHFFAPYVAFSLGQSPNYPKKPTPDMVCAALDKLGSTKSHALYVGDSEVDALTAQNSGLDVALVTWGFRDESVLQDLHATYIVKTPKELETIILSK